MTSNPIIAAIAREAVATDWPISGITLCAPMVTGHPILAINWSVMLPDGDDSIDAPKGIAVMSFSRAPSTEIAVPPLTDPEGLVIEAAWSHGAWDVKRTAVAADYTGALPPYTASIATDVRAQGYVAWYWRPMMRGPEIRGKAYGHRDASLNRWTLGRDGKAPEVRTPRIVANREHIIKLGQSEKRDRQSRTIPASDRQRAYLSRLLQDAGEDNALPDDLDKRVASAWIDRLTGTTPPAPSMKAHKRTIGISVNQWRMIEYLLHRLGRPGINPYRMTYDEAQALIDKLKGEL